MATQTATKRKNGDHAKEEEKQHLPATTTGLPAHLAGLAEADAGKGVSTAQEDNIIPLVYILQAQSPQVMRGPGQIEGAQAGDIWLRNSAVREIMPGGAGIVVQPCAFSKSWIEWVPRDSGGGFIARHAVRPADAIQDPDDPNHWTRPNGNELVETREHYVMAEGQPYVIPFSSTGHTTSRTWMALMNQFRIGAAPAPSWARRYRLSTVQRTNSLGTWYQWKVEDLGWVPSQEEYQVGKMLHEAVTSGAKRAADHDAAAPADEVPF